MKRSGPQRLSSCLPWRRAWCSWFLCTGGVAMHTLGFSPGPSAPRRRSCWGLWRRHRTSSGRCKLIELAALEAEGESFQGGASILGGLGLGWRSPDGISFGGVERVFLLRDLLGLWDLRRGVLARLKWPWGRFCLTGVPGAEKNWKTYEGLPVSCGLHGSSVS